MQYIIRHTTLQTDNSNEVSAINRNRRELIIKCALPSTAILSQLSPFGAIVHFVNLTPVTKRDAINQVLHLFLLECVSRASR
jgi:hypothetical protein